MTTAIDEKPAHEPAKPTWRREPPLLANADCTICRGTGWRLLATVGGSRAQRCSCGDLQRLHLTRDQVRIPERYEHCRIDNFEPVQYSQFQALRAARRFTAQFPGQTRDLFFSGGPGVGKTHLAVGIVHELIHRFQENICFVELASFLAELRFARPTVDEWDPLRRAQLLVLDNFGSSGQIQQHAVRSMEQLLHLRWRMGRPIIFTGDRVESEEVFSGAEKSAAPPTVLLLSQLTQRTRTRILSGTKIMSIHGIDHRKKSSDRSVLFS